MTARTKALAAVIATLNKYTQYDMLNELIQNMLERAQDGHSDAYPCEELAKFVLSQIDGDAEQVVASFAARPHALKVQSKAGIKQTAIPNGIRYEGKGCQVDITNDGRFFTIYNDAGKPLGTITRPAVIGGNRFWECHDTQGNAITTTAVGPRGCFSRFINHK